MHEVAEVAFRAEAEALIQVALMVAAPEATVMRAEVHESAAVAIMADPFNQCRALQRRCTQITVRFDSCAITKA